MNVPELIDQLSTFDPEAKLVVEYDTHFCDIRAVQPEVILTEGGSWADYPSVKVLENHPMHRSNESGINVSRELSRKGHCDLGTPPYPRLTLAKDAWNSYKPDGLLSKNSMCKPSWFTHQKPGLHLRLSSPN